MKNKSLESIKRKKSYIENHEERLLMAEKRRNIPKVKYYNYGYNAKTRNYDFDLSYNEFIELLKKPCFYCSAIEKIGLDRVNNLIGYTIDNTVSCCNLCNKMKTDLPIDIFIEQCKKIYQNKSL